ncbi:MAG TPA: ABC transporter permease [Candidatus Polarisedimenticolia bacterium]|nr:ABC transporter permease [Candidatus Polarisedimenticolia bacterium]
MSLRHRITTYFRNLRRGPAADREIDDEIDATLDLMADERERAGLTPDEARRAARLDLAGGAAPGDSSGAPFGVEAVKESVRDARPGAALDGWLADIRQALRGMARTPAFSAIVVLTLGVGIGAAMAIFGVVEATLLRPLPYPGSDRLALIWAQFGSESKAPASGHQFLALRERSALFEAIGGIWVRSAALTGHGEPEQIRVGFVTADFLPLLVERPALGRHFTADEVGPGQEPLVILANELWRRRIGADEAIVGRTIQMDGQAVEVRGVLPERFRVAFPEASRIPPDIDAFMPMPFDLAGGPLDVSFIRMLGRMRPGTTERQAQAEVDGIAAGLRAEYKDYASQELQFRVAPLHAEVVHTARPAILALSGGVALVLLIACINVASLLLARGAERQRELTMRSALGAAPARLVRLLLTESVCLAAAGGGLALVLGWWGLAALQSLQPEGVARAGPTQVNLAVFGFALAITLAAGILSGLAPAVTATRGRIADALKRGGRGQAGGGAHRARNVLIGCEVALGCAVLASAGLMARTLHSLLRVDPGFDARGTLTLQVSLPGPRYPSDHDRVDFARRIQEKLAALPGVESAGMGSNLPLDNSLPNWYAPYWLEDTPEDERNTMADHRSVLPGFFRSIGARLLEGRDFEPVEIEQGRLVAIVDDSLARRTWPGRSAVGQRMALETMIEGEFKWQVAEVIGVVRHVQFHSLVDEVREQVYIPYSLASRQQISFALRTSGDPESLAAPARAALAALDADLPAARVVPLGHYVERARRATRFLSLLSASLAAIALLLAVVGVYGVSSGSVTRRTSEIGVRVALGAKSGDVLRLVLSQGMKPVALGCVAGLALSVALAPLYSHLLYGVRPFDPATYVLVTALIAAAGLLACWVPARRAVRLDPLEALRAE